MDRDALPEGWVVWNEDEDTVVLAFRPDVFDGGEYPAACLPTIYVTRGKRDRRPGGHRVGSDWHVTLFLEPDVDLDPQTYDDRPAAVAGAADLAERFAAGEVDYRDAYQVGRPEYFERLDELTGSDRSE